MQFHYRFSLPELTPEAIWGQTRLFLMLILVAHAGPLRAYRRGARLEQAQRFAEKCCCGNPPGIRPAVSQFDVPALLFDRPVVTCMAVHLRNAREIIQWRKDAFNLPKKRSMSLRNL
jgi:hypothetical protein